jgi:predicted O-linked N-acetylglucosamine transferase (SPINDLY family)
VSVSPPASRNAPCPCGSGLRYKSCHGSLGASAAALAPTPGGPDTSIDAESLFHLGNACRQRGELGTALEHYLRALERTPGNAALLNNIGLVHSSLDNAAAAADFFMKALAVEPDHPAALANLAQHYYRQKRDAEALALFDRLIGARPVAVAAIWANRGICLSRLGDLAQAATSFERALALEPDSLGVHLDAAWTYVKRDEFGPALAHFDAARRIDPSCRVADIAAIGCRQRLLQWEGYAAHRSRVLEIAPRIDAEPAQYLGPFEMLTLTDDPSLHLTAARSATRHAVPVLPPVAPAALPRRRPRLRLGFVSSDFRNHPVGRLLIGLLERLDRRSFEVLTYAVGPERADAIASRTARASERHVYAGWALGTDLARRIRDDDVDVLFDLNGYSGVHVLDVFSRRPAPVQVNYLGYTGTLGCDAYDFIIADSYCIPAAEERWYAERVLRVDPCYLSSDAKQEISNEPLDRAMYGLPNGAPVLCCFAPTYKILPDFLDGLGPILRDHADAVLWLRHAESDVAARLRAEAQARGIRDRQIVLAPSEATPRYLARFRLADVFVDTFPFGAHTTVNDALAAGLPVLAAAGRSFASRASASQVRAAGLPDFVSDGLPAHFAKLEELLESPQRVSDAARRLAQGAATAPLFDLDGYARAFERAIEGAWVPQRRREGK